VAENEPDGSWSLTDWTVLGLLVEQPRHGFSLVKELSPDTLLGHVWSIPNPMIYRSLRALQAREMITPAPTAGAALGPRRVSMRPTAAGRRRFHKWVRLPVDHFRDARVLLRVKLHLTVRLGRDPVPLLREQEAIFTALGTAMARSSPPGSRLERDLLRTWREDSSSAALEFVRHALAILEAPGRPTS
jgi:DNA-binding PadR family transcriptional regulator